MIALHVFIRRTVAMHTVGPFFLLDTGHYDVTSHITSSPVYAPTHRYGHYDIKSHFKMGGGESKKVVDVQKRRAMCSS